MEKVDENESLVWIGECAGVKFAAKESVAPKAKEMFEGLKEDGINWRMQLIQRPQENKND